MDVRSVLALASALALVACHDSSGGTSGSVPQTTNLVLAIDDMTGDGNLWLLSVPEADQGGSDLNGDGDALDHVLHVLDLGTGALTNTSLDVTPPPPGPIWNVHGSLAAFGVSEAGQGGLDRNGDGDTLDWGLHLYDHEAGSVQDLEVSVEHIAFVDEGIVGFHVSEFAEGHRDLDGDGSALGSVLHYHDSSLLEVVNVGLASIPQFHGGLMALRIPEWLGGLDLNGDGDAIDSDIVHIFDTRTRQLESLGVATDHFGLFFGEGLLVVPVLEGANGGEDLNGDGDARDEVIHVYDPATRILRDTGLSGPDPGMFRPDGSSSEGRLLLFTGETDGLDRNGDGDVQDVLPVLFEPTTGQAIDPRLAIDPFLSAPANVSFVGELLAITVSETKQDLDLNGDGDLLDKVVHVADPVRDTVSNLRLPGGFQATSSLLVITRLEEATGPDLNGDGDRGDAVPLLWDRRTRATINTRISSTGVALGATDERILFLEREELPGGGFKPEYILYDVRRRVPHFLGLLAAFRFRAQLTPSGVALFSVNELFQGTDLNGDGDLDDDVLHVVE